MKRILSIILSMNFIVSVYAYQTDRYDTIYTTNGSPVEVYICASDLSASEIEDFRLEISTNYPDVKIVAPASQLYNCHGYAWVMTEGGITCRLYQGNNAFNLANFWNDGSFYSVSENKSFKIHYYEGDHSAIALPGTTKYRSKWGNGPLIEHEPEEGPYNNMNKRHYYSNYDGSYKTGLLQCSRGTGAIGVNVTATYSNSTFPDDDYHIFVWSVQTPKGDDAIDSGKASFQVGLYPYSADISFSAAGLYEVILSVYDFRYNLLGEFCFEPVVE